MNAKDFDNLPHANQIRLFAILGISIFVLIGIFALPLSLVFEFGFRDYVNFFVPNYPHLTLYPSMIFWAAGICSIIIIWHLPIGKSQWRLLLACAAPAILLSAVVTYIEQSGDNMMVLEFNQETQSQYCMREIIESVDGTAVEVPGDRYEALSAFILENANPGSFEIKADGSSLSISYENALEQELFDALFAYQRWGENKESFSASRLAYIASVYCLVAIIIWN